MVGALIASAVVSAGAAVYSGAKQREAAQNEADYQRKQNAIKAKAEVSNRDTALGKLEKELGLDKQAAYSKAGDIESSATSGFTGAMESTYLGQLGAEAGLMDLKQSGAEALGTITAGAGIGGLRAPTTTTQVVDSQIREKVNLTRKQIDSGRDISVSQNKANLDLNLKNAGEMRGQFDAGSAYMDMYGYTRQRIQGSSDIALASLAAQDSYLKDLSKSYDYNGGWFLTDLFNVAGAGLDAYTTGYGLKVFGG